MSQTEYGNPFESIQSEVLSSLNNFDKERGELYDWLASVATELPDVSDYHPDTRERITDTAVAFALLAKGLQSTGGTDETKELLTKLISQDDAERIKLFSGLVDSQDFYHMDYDRIEEMVDDVYSMSDDEADLNDTVYDMYRLLLSGDVQLLASFIQEKHEEHLPEEVVLGEIVIDPVRMKKVARDIAKIALGVAGGVAANYLFKKRLS